MSQPAAGESTTESLDRGTVRRQWIGVALGSVLAVVAYLLLPDGLSPEGRVTAAIAVLMAVCG